MTLQVDKSGTPETDEVSPYPLFDLTRAIASSRTLDDIYRAALDCLRDCLGVTKASVLLFDPDAVMRFKAWLDLSPEYRQAVEGHTPWTPETVDPQPVLVADVREEPSLEHLCPAIEAEGIRALAFFPLAINERLLGKFMLYYPEPHVMSRNEILISQTIAAHVAFALDRHAVRQDRREWREHLEGIFRSPVVGIAEVDVNARFRVVSDRYCELIGRSREELLDGMTVYDVTHPEDLEVSAQAINDLEGGGGHFVMEKRYLKPSGEVVWASTSVSAVHDEHGSLKGAIAVVTDITGRRLGEQRARDAARRYQELMEALNVAVYTTDADGRITYFNEAAAEAWGQRPEVGVDLWCGSWKIFTPNGEPVPLDECPMAFALKENRPVRGVEIVVERPDGTRLNVLPHPTPLRDSDGNLTGAVNVLVDITQRKHIEEALRESEERLKAELAATQVLQEASSQLIREDDSNAIYEQIMDAAVAIMHADKGSMQILDESQDALHLLTWRGFGPDFGKTFEWVRADTRTSCRAAWVADRRVIIEDVQAYDFIAQTPWLEAHFDIGIRASQSTPLKSRSGKLLGMITTHWERPHKPSDSELHLMDVLARQAADLMERAAAELALRESEEHLRTAAALKDEFLGLVSHELRTPISTILGNGLLLIRNWGTIPEDDRQQALTDIAGEAEKLQEIIENLLLITRMEAGQLDSEPLAMTRLIEESIADFQRMHPERSLSFAPQDGLAPALGDASLVPLIMRNLLSNADKYSPPEKPIEISLRFDHKSECLEVAVRDYGIGLDKTDLDVVFEPFFRAKRSRTYAKGMGLGLAVCKRVTEAQGGRIWVESQTDEGSRFVFQLKAVRPLELAE